MNYDECITFLNNIPKQSATFSTDNMFRLLNKMNNPQDKLKVIHVAGTNGKGSVTNIIKSILIEENYNIGLFNSPYVLSYRETITYNNKIISKRDFSKIITAIAIYCNELTEEGFSHPSAFECYTALAFEYFNIMSVDIAIIEVGLGGVNDSTNVFKSPLLTIITSIAFDHTEFLGNSLADIASSKAGILKEKAPVIIAPNSNEALNVILNTAFKYNAPYYCLSNNDIQATIYKEALNGISFSLKTPYFKYDNLYMKLIGQHQIINAALALTSIEVLKKQYKYKISENSIRLGLENTYWPCRCEYIEHPTPMLIDSAHNEQSMDTFVKVLSNYCTNMPITFLFGVLRDKEADKLLQQIKPFSDTIFITSPISPRAFLTKELANISSKYFTKVFPIDNAFLALQSAIEYSRKTNSLLCCVGSLYLSIPARNWIENELG